MALDGFVLANVVHELRTHLLGGRIDKVYQIEKEDILLSIRNQKTAYKVLLTANSQYPRLHLSTQVKNQTQEPPMFCMLLRKHLGGGKLIDIIQPDMERIVIFSFEVTNELGDKEIKQLIIEVMGRHSNIILIRQDHMIIDSIKHISLDKSSVREVLPGRTYIKPLNGDKLNPLEVNQTVFISKLKTQKLSLFKALYTSFNGLSPLFAQNLCDVCQIDSDTPSEHLSDEAFDTLYQAFSNYINQVKQHQFKPTLYFDAQHLAKEFYCFSLPLLKESDSQYFESISNLLEHYYLERNTHFNVAQKTGDIKKLLHNFLDRNVRKKQIQEKALEESAQKELYKIYGELLTAYAYQIPNGSSEFTTLNYYEDPACQITIPLDASLTPIENAQAYYKLYNKLKRTESAAQTQLQTIEEDTQYLQSVLLSLELLETKEDIEQLRLELFEMGYLKKRKQNASKMKTRKKDLPFLHFKSTTGFDIYVGKNNYQNDELTMKFAKPTDMWLHIKEGPGSHVIIKNHLSSVTLDEQTLLEGALLAAYYSSGKMSSRVPIDYTFKRHVKKVPNAKPGMVIYTHFKTLYVTPTKAFIETLSS